MWVVRKGEKDEEKKNSQFFFWEFLISPFNITVSCERKKNPTKSNLVLSVQGLSTKLLSVLACSPCVALIWYCVEKHSSDVVVGVYWYDSFENLKLEIVRTRDPYARYDDTRVCLQPSFDVPNACQTDAFSSDLICVSLVTTWYWQEGFLSFHREQFSRRVVIQRLWVFSQVVSFSWKRKNLVTRKLQTTNSQLVQSYWCDVARRFLNFERPVSRCLQRRTHRPERLRCLLFKIHTFVVWGPWTGGFKKGLPGWSCQ